MNWGKSRSRSRINRTLRVHSSPERNDRTLGPILKDMVNHSISCFVLKAIERGIISNHRNIIKTLRSSWLLGTATSMRSWQWNNSLWQWIPVSWLRNHRAIANPKGSNDHEWMVNWKRGSFALRSPMNSVNHDQFMILQVE
jgi:hypothetical protein